MTTPPRQPVTPATAAEWRRRREASAELPVDTGNGTPRKGFRVPAYAVALPSRSAGAADFTDSQHSGLAAIIGIAAPSAPPWPHPAAAEPAEVSTAPAEPLPASTAPAGPVAVSVTPAVPEPVAAQAAPAVSAPEAVSAAPAELAEEAPASQEPTVAGGSSGSANRSALPLIVILTVQTVLSLRLLRSNTAFTDEALYLWAGRLEWSHWLHGTPMPPFAPYFSGAPVLYPAIGALANSFGGLVGARVLSLCFMLGATVLLYGVTRRIFDRPSAVFASALFAGLGSAQYLSAFATYDAMALFFLATATWLGIRSAAYRSTTGRLALLLAAAVALVVADATKYAAALFDPVVIVAVACFHWRELGRRAGLLAGFLVACGTVFGIAGALAWGGKSYYLGVASTTLSRTPGNWPIFGILFVSAGWVGAIAILAVIGAAAASCSRRTASQRILAWTLAAAAFLAPAEQARIHVFTSLFKHVAFGGWFGAVVAGYALTAFIRAVPAAKARGALHAVLALIAATWIIGLLLAADQYDNWPDINPVLPALTATLRAHPGPLLVDTTAPFDYYLIGTQSWQRITAIPRSSAQAETQVVRQRQFSVILLSYSIGGGGCGNEDPSVKSTQASCPHYVDLRMLADLLSDGGYNLVARIPYETTAFKSVYMIWAREDSR